MVRRALRSTSFRTIKIRTPGSNIVTHYKKKKPHKAKCGNCGGLLKAIPREFPTKMQNLAKTKKRPQRAFGGVLCTKCTRELFKQKAKSLE
jgi:large subunit ribosomal protein L34e